MSKAAPQSRPLLIRFHEAAGLLGMSVRWLQEQVTANVAPVVRAGRSVRMRRADVEAFARDGRWPGAKSDEAVVIGKDNEINPHVAVKKRGHRP
jgi:excisionase family DNA binding protein